MVLSPYTTEAELRWLYENATAFCLPSLLEGFGMPALEAASRGLVSVLSGGGALEEAVGSCAVLVDPLSAPSIAQGLTRAVRMRGAESRALAAAAQGHAQKLSRERFLASWRDLLLAEGAVRQAA